MITIINCELKIEVTASKGATNELFERVHQQLQLKVRDWLEDQAFTSDDDRIDAEIIHFSLSRTTWT